MHDNNSDHFLDSLRYANAMDEFMGKPTIITIVFNTHSFCFGMFWSGKSVAIHIGFISVEIYAKSLSNGKWLSFERR